MLAANVPPPDDNLQSPTSPDTILAICVYCSQVEGDGPGVCLLNEPDDFTGTVCPACFAEWDAEFSAGIRSPLRRWIRLRRLHIWGMSECPDIHLNGLVSVGLGSPTKENA